MNKLVAVLTPTSRPCFHTMHRVLHFVLLQYFMVNTVQGTITHKVSFQPG